MNNNSFIQNEREREKKCQQQQPEKKTLVFDNHWFFHSFIHEWIIFPETKIGFWSTRTHKSSSHRYFSFGIYIRKKNPAMNKTTDRSNQQ